MSDDALQRQVARIHPRIVANLRVIDGGRDSNPLPAGVTDRILTSPVRVRPRPLLAGR